jgi:hypothetical protein
VIPYRAHPDEEEDMAQKLARLLELELGLRHATRRRIALFHAAALLSLLPWIGWLGHHWALAALSKGGLGAWLASLVLGVAFWLDERDVERRRDRLTAELRARGGRP